MPLFDFLCDQCGTRFEELVANASAGVRCTNCGSLARKLPSAFAVAQSRGKSSRSSPPQPSSGGT